MNNVLSLIINYIESGFKQYKYRSKLNFDKSNYQITRQKII